MTISKNDPKERLINQAIDILADNEIEITIDNIKDVIINVLNNYHGMTGHEISGYLRKNNRITVVGSKRITLKSNVGSKKVIIYERK